MPFLLDLFRIPADTFQLFLATSVINVRFGALQRRSTTVTVALLGSAAILGAVRFNGARIMRYLIITVVLSAALLGGLANACSATALKQSFAGEELVYGMRSLMQFFRAAHR